MCFFLFLREIIVVLSFWLGEINKGMGKYIDARSVFPSKSNGEGDFQPELLPQSPGDIIKLAASKAKELPVLFYGRSSIYENFKAWPNDKLLIPVAVTLSLNTQKFFEELKVATSGFYFLEADDEKDLGLTRGIDYRNSQSKGICLMLASTFSNRSEYLQARGRVKRGNDEGQVWELQEQMWRQGT